MNGEILKRIREDRLITLEEAALDVMSVSQLSKFERGLCDITITKLLGVLKNLNLSIEEYIYIIKGYQSNEFDKFLKEVEVNYLSKNINILDRIYNKEKKHYKESQNKYHLYNSLMVLSSLSSLDSANYSLSEEDKEILIDYLLSVSEWQYYEIILFANTISCYTVTSVTILAKELLGRSIFYINSKDHKRMILQTIFNVIIICLEKDSVEQANYFLKYIENKLILESEIYEKIMFKYLNGFYLVKSKKSVGKGKKDMFGVVQLFEFIEADNLYYNYKNHYEALFPIRK